MDIFANNIIRLAGYLGRGLDHTAKLAFMTGFPGNVSVALQLVPSMKKIPSTRLLVIKRLQEPRTVAAIEQCILDQKKTMVIWNHQVGITPN